MWQVAQRERFREKLYCYLVTIFAGEAERQLRSLGVGGTAGMRHHLFTRFGGGMTVELREKERKYNAGLPKTEGAPAFPDRCDMADRLNALEDMREYFIRVCPSAKLDDYEPTKLTKLVRIILEHLPQEYDVAVQEAKNLVRMRGMFAGDKEACITNLQDIHHDNFDESWLPQYDELRTALLNAHSLMKRRWAVEKKVKVPTMMVGSGTQPGPNNITCYGCGKQGHRRGSAECSAGPNAVWSGAPDGWKSAQRNGRGGGSGRGGGRGNGSGRGSGKGRGSNICFSHSTGSGYCRYGDNCKFEHTGPPGGGGGSKVVAKKKPKGNGGGHAKSSWADRKMVKKVTTMVAKALEKKSSQKAQALR